MKTPREILLESHRAMEPRLDRVREKALAAELSHNGPPQAASLPKTFLVKTIPLTLWGELIWPSRKAWAGLAAVWVALAVVHYSEKRDNGPAHAPMDTQVLAAWDEQQKVLQQLMDPRVQMAEKRSMPAGPTPGSGKSAEWGIENKTMLA